MLYQIKAFRTVAFLVIAGALLGQNVPALFDRPGGLVPDEHTAVAIAEAVLFPIYGEKAIRGQKPYVVKLADGKWTIDGTMPKSNAIRKNRRAAEQSEKVRQLPSLRRTH